jgi:hypothetical protein
MVTVKMRDTSLVGTIMSALILSCIAGFDANNAQAHNFLNCADTEPAINSSPNTLFCDDIEDGDWIVTNADTSGGKTNPSNDGWRGGIFTPWPDPAGTGWGRCGGKGAAGTDCAATTGFINCGDGCDGTNGKHEFSPSFGTGVTEIYVRKYIKLLPGFTPGHTKDTTLQNDAGYQCCLTNFPGFSNFGAIQMDSPMDAGLMTQNLGNALTIVPGRWYYHEIHVVLGAPGPFENNPGSAGCPSCTGLYEMWLDDCGTSGTECKGPGTLRARWTNRRFRASSSDNITLWWVEAWANPGSVGEIHRDQFVASKVRVGPRSMTPLAAPTNLRVIGTN